MSFEESRLRKKERREKERKREKRSISDRNAAVLPWFRNKWRGGGKGWVTATFKEKVAKLAKEFFA